MAELTNLDGLKTVIHPSAGLYLHKGTSELSQSWLLDTLNGKIYSRFFDGDTQLIELPDFDWCEGHPHRSWWGEMQRLSFLSWYVSSRALFDEDKKRHSIIFTKKALLNWIDKASDNKKSPLAWHDHSSALRLMNIINWLSSIAIEETYTDLINDAEVIKIIDSISRHVEFLLDEKFYTRHTNHGFDQALVLYTSSLIWGGGGVIFLPARMRLQLQGCLMKFHLHLPIRVFIRKIAPCIINSCTSGLDKLSSWRFLVVPG